VKNVTVVYGKFEWNRAKELISIRDHHCDFKTAAEAFKDPKGLLTRDEKHSENDRQIHSSKKQRQNYRCWILEKGQEVL